MNINRGDILFVYGNALIDEAIEDITHGASHCALFIDDGKILADANGGRPIGEHDISFYLSQNCRLEVWEDATLTDNERDIVIDYAKTFYGAHYDYPGIFWELLHFETGMNIDWYKENHEFICSGYLGLLPKKINKKWSNRSVPAPYDLQVDGYLRKKFALK